MRLKHIPLGSLLFFAIACDPGDPGPADPADPNAVDLSVDQSTEGVMGPRTYTGTCDAEDVQFNEKSTFYARVAASSTAFAQCLDNAMRTGFAGFGPYRKCNSDPYYSSAIGEQYTRALAAARSESGLTVACSGGGGNASTSIGTYTHAGDESYWWGGWFRGVWSQVDMVYGGSIGMSGYRYAPEPWPYDQAAGIVWHEAMHQFGYTHGANDQANAKVNCGYGSDPTWHFQVNTLPYILGNCVSWVISQSGQTCGGDLENCGAGALRLIDGASSTTCSCVSDPRPMVPAAPNYNVQNKSLGDFAGFISQAGVQVASGDFDGDGRTDLAAVGGSGWASIPVAFSRGDGSFRVTNNTVSNFPVYATQAGAKLIAGDFNKDGRDDLALTHGSGWTTLPVAFSSGDGNFSVTNSSIGAFASWAQSSTALAGDFDGDGATDIALTAGAGWASMPVAFSNRDGTFRVTNEYLADFPGMSTQSGAQAVAGDFDGDGDDDVALAGGSTWSTVPVAFSNRNGAFSVTNLGADYLPSYAASSGLRLRAADFDGDGKDDLLVTNAAWSFSIHGRSLGNGAFSAYWRDLGSSFTAWQNDGSLFSGDFNADGRADLALARIGAGGWGSVPVALSVVAGRVGAEYNNHRDDATAIPSYINEVGLSIGYRSDVDFYSFDMTTTAYVWVSLSFFHSRGDLDVALLDANGAVVVSSTGVTDTEGFLRQVPPGRYYVKVYGYGGATGEYGLQIAR